jgi:hypothetical protein
MYINVKEHDNLRKNMYAGFVYFPGKLDVISMNTVNFFKKKVKLCFPSGRTRPWGVAGA